MSVCQSIMAIDGVHRLEWRSTFDGRGYWQCLNANCGEVEPDIAEHHGG